MLLHSLRSLACSTTILNASLMIGGVACFAVAPSASAQTVAAPNAEDAAYIAVVKGTDVYVRCGGAESYYPFAKVSDGDLIKVTGQKFEWARVTITGPAFRSAYGYIKFAKGDAGKVRLAADGKSLTTLGRVEIIAPNLDSKGAPKDSWKSIARMEADQNLAVIESMDADKDTILKVALPESAQGWISLPYLEKATPEQAKQYEQSLHAAPIMPATPTKPSAGPNAAKPAAGTAKPANKPDGAPAATDDPTVTPADGTSPGASAPVDNSSASASAETAASKPAASQPEKPKGPPTLDDLEAAYKKLQREPVETAEVIPLRELYLELADRSTDKPMLAARAKGRAEQLQIWADAQKRRQEISDLQGRLKLSADETEAVRLALERSAEYTAVGRVAASTIYDGKSLPKLLRLQDAATGRTIAYLQPDEKYELVNLVDKVIGVVGDKTYDGALRLNIIAPRRIDILNPQQKPAS